jgi:leucyl/phenylalanyl-tRNA--protein transferase
MTVFRLGRRLVFPPAELADESGILAVGGDLRPERLLLAYRSGIFPWYDEGLPILWHSPDPRFVLEIPRLRLRRSLRKVLRHLPYEIALDGRFRDVIDACSEAPRPGQDGTWITSEMRDAYVRLHQLGFAHSCEAFDGGELVGGLYGVALGSIFFGESMFARRPDASKCAFAVLVRQLAAWGFTLVDCQVWTEHLASFGAEEWPRSRYLRELKRCLETPRPSGRWAFDRTAAELAREAAELALR